MPECQVLWQVLWLSVADSAGLVNGSAEMVAGL